jgi:DNA-directed RNA polymerase subunit RPC12/RpoP
MKLRCFHCEQELEITSTQLGGNVSCPHCRSPIRVPRTQPEDVTAEGRFALRMQRCLRGSVSALVSVVVHMSLLFVLALVTCDYRSGEGWSGEVLIGQLPSVDLTGDEQPQLDTQPINSPSPSQPDLVLDLVEPPSGNAGDDALEIDIAAMTASGAFGAALVYLMRGIALHFCDLFSQTRELLMRAFYLLVGVCEPFIGGLD